MSETSVFDDQYKGKILKASDEQEIIIEFERINQQTELDGYRKLEMLCSSIGLLLHSSGGKWHISGPGFRYGVTRETLDRLRDESFINKKNFLNYGIRI